LDLSGTLYGAGGVGGLLYSSGGTTSVSSVFYTHDGSGNVTDLLDLTAAISNGNAVVARHDYDPFGNVLSEISNFPISNTFKFSTKYFDPETGLSYYGYRHYSPSLGRWLSRDPLEEAGGMNLLGFVNNDPVNGVDPLGLAGYFFGGTGNSLDPEGISNIEILYRAWDNTKNGSAYYVPGVFSGYAPDGRRYSRIERARMLSEGAAGRTLGERVSAMMGHLDKELKSGDREVNVFGFSRGATSAMEFLNRIQDRVDAGDPLYQCVIVNMVALWDTVRTTAFPYRTEIPRNLVFRHKPLHFIALDEQRSEFFDKEVLDVEGAWQIGFRGVHADVGGGYPNSPFDWLSRNEAVYAGQMAGVSFNNTVLANYRRTVNWKATPTENDTFYYNGKEPRVLPKNITLHWSVAMFNWYTKPANSAEDAKDMRREDWLTWAGRQ
jgi:RHS repeat-associated protein